MSSAVPHLFFYETIDKTAKGTKGMKPQMDTKKSMITKTFASVGENICNIPQSQLPIPCMKGDRLAIIISEEEHKLGLEACKHNTHGKIL